MIVTAVQNTADAFHDTDPKFDFWSESHKFALERLNEALQNTASLNIFTGDPGAGKSTVVRRAIAAAKVGNPIGLLSYSDNLGTDLKSAILVSLGVDRDWTEEISAAGDFAGELRSVKAERGFPTLILDDAHLLEFDRLLDLLRDARIGLQDEPVLKVILVGLDELQDTLNSPYSRVKGPAFRLDPMSEEDTAHYIRNRMANGGYESVFFTDDAIAAAFEIASGNPDRINSVCARALDKAKRKGIREIDPGLFEETAGSISRSARDPNADPGPLTPSMREAIGRSDDKPNSKVIVLNPEALSRSDRLRPQSDQKTNNESESAPARNFDNAKSGAKRQSQVARAPTTLDRQYMLSSSPGIAPPDPPSSRGDPDVKTSLSVPKVKGNATGTSIEGVVAFCSGKSESTAAPARSSDGCTNAIARRVEAPATDRKLLLRDNWNSSNTEIPPHLPVKAGIGAARATVAAALFCGVLVVGWIAIEPEFGTNTTPDSALSQSVGGATPEAVAGLENSSQLAATVDDPEALPENLALAQLAVIEDIAAGVYVQQSALPSEDGIGTPQQIENVRLALGEVAGGPDELFRLALSIPGSEPEAAATAYSLAALGGHDRAAYYLGQMYELGEGVPRNLDIARAWYDLGARSMPGSRTRSDALAGHVSKGEVLAPVPLYSRTLPGEQVEMVWSVASNAAASKFTIEFSDGQGQTVTAMLGHSLPALRSNLPPGANNWRVGASTDATGVHFSEWIPIE